MNTKPNIQLTMNIMPLTEEEFKRVGVGDLVDPKINLHRSNYRYWYGKSARQDNNLEYFEYYLYDFVYYAKDVDEATMGDIYREKEMIIFWTPLGQKEQIKKYDIGEILEYK